MQIGVQGGLTAPSYVMIDGERYVCFGPRLTKGRWFDIPLTREESIKHHSEVSTYILLSVSFHMLLYCQVLSYMLLGSVFLSRDSHNGKIRLYHFRDKRAGVPGNEIPQGHLNSGGIS